MASLLSNGANVNAVDEDGRTSLHIACCNTNVSCVQILLSHGAKINIFDKEKVAAPLFCAVASGSGADSEAVVDLLMKNGADINLGLSMVFRAIILKRGYAWSALMICFDSELFPQNFV